MRQDASLLFLVVSFVSFVAFLVQASPGGSEDARYGVEAQQLFKGGVEPDLHLDDGASPSNPFAPWSYQPVCTQEMVDLENEPLCVYTNSTFSDGRGISIVTTPQVAVEFAALLPFQDPAILAQKGINTLARDWYTQKLPGKGVGALAKKHFERGDMIMAYTPLLLAQAENVLSTLDREKFLRIAIDQLPPPSQELYFSLAKIYNDPRVAVQDVVKANAFEIQIGGRRHLAVFPETARLNHDCAANAQYTLQPSLLSHVTRAARPISPGEEITVSYQNPFEPTSTRQESLRDAFHFTCACSRCLNSEASDAALAEIGALRSSLNNWSSNPDSNDATIEKAERLIQLYVQENLHAFIDQAYALAALAYNSVGNADEARKHAQQAAETLVIRLAPEAADRDLEHVRQILENAEGHWSWRRRWKE